jgi:hypothetical protein
VITPTSVHFTDRPTLMGDPVDDAYRQRNFDLCRAVNLISLGCVLEAMKKAGLPHQQADCFMAAADALLQLMRTENNRLRVTPPPEDYTPSGGAASMKPTSDTGSAAPGGSTPLGASYES